MMNVPNEIILLIFDNIIAITDKRQFLRTCKMYNNITKKSFKQHEDNFTIKYFEKINNYCVEKFTLELCHDGYCNMIPLSYINPNNTILVRTLVFFNCIDLLQIAKNNGCKLDFICDLAAEMGQLEVLKWGKENGYHLGSMICIFASKNGHLDILKWAINNSCAFRYAYCSYWAETMGHTHIINWLMEHEVSQTKLTNQV
jgi:hypothetical protein